MKKNILHFEFIPYEQAIALKGLGFDEECLASWSPKTKELIPTLYGCGVLLFNVDGLITNKTEDILCSAPLYKQAFRWFREKHNLNAEISYSMSYKWQYIINDMIKDDVVCEILYFKTFEEAELECLKKLIEIVKNEKFS